MTGYNLEKYLKHLEVSQADTTIKTKKSIIKQFLDWYNPHKSPTDNYDSFLLLKKNIDKVSQDYIQLCGVTIKEFLKFHNVNTEGMKLPSKTKNRRESLTNNQVHELLEATHEDYTYLIVMLLLNTGLRISELCNLRWEDIDFHTRKLVVQHGKGDKQRNIPLNDTAIGTLYELRKTNSDYVITTTKGKQITPRAVQLYFQTISNITGFKVTPHILRHTFATNMIQKGLDVTVLQKILGHESLNTTMRYIHHDFNTIQQKFMEVQ